MRLLVLALLLAIAGCEKTAPSPTPPAGIKDEASVRPPPPTPAASPVAGWSMEGGGFLLLGRQAPAFSGKLLSGDEANLEKLRGRWTILAFRNLVVEDKTEDAFVSALNSAADQDPDLDFVEVFVPSDASRGAQDASRRIDKRIPALPDVDRKVASAFGVNDLPIYLLIGPDLTIEAARGRLAATPDNGIKDVIRGVAEIRKQIADPT
jgi:peroxiredoxin